MLKDGDMITINAESGDIGVDLTDEELAERRKHWKPRETDYQSGAIWKYAQTVGSGKRGHYPAGW